MLGRFAETVTRRPAAAVATGLTLLVAALGVALEAPGALGISSLRLDRPAPKHEIALHTRGEFPVRSRIYRIALDVITTRLHSDSAVVGVGVQEDGRRSVTLLIDLGEATPRATQQTLARLERSLDPGPLRVSFAGEAAELVAARERIGGELWRLELLALPPVLLIVGFALGIRLAAAALAAAALAVLGTAALLRLATGAFEPSLIGLVAGAPVGALLAIELTRLLGARHREALALGIGQRALTLAIAEWWPVAIPAALAAGLAPLPLLATPLDGAEWLAVGSGLGACLAVAGTLLFAGPALALGAASTIRTRAVSAGTRPRRRWPVVAAATASLAVLVGLGVAALDARSTAIGIAEPASLPSELPLAAGIMIAGSALVLALAGRSIKLALLAPLCAAPALAALGLAVLVLGPELDSAALAGALSAVVAICLARSVQAVALISAEAPAVATARDTARRVAALTLPAAARASVAGALTAGSLVAADEPALREFGLIVAAGVLLDLLPVRIAFLAIAARLR